MIRVVDRLLFRMLKKLPVFFLPQLLHTSLFPEIFATNVLNESCRSRDV